MKKLSLFLSALLCCAVFTISRSQTTPTQLWGMSVAGGGASGCIFNTDANGSSPTLVKSFKTLSPGAFSSELVQASNGKLYGLAGQGQYNSGIIYEYDINTNTSITKYDFDGLLNGGQPVGRMIEISGKLYGVTALGGTYDDGVIFEYNLSTGVFTKKIDFNGTKGRYANGGLMLATNGKLYGATSAGGAHDVGALYEYNLSANTLTLKSSFANISSQGPWGELVQGGDGYIYGTTVGDNDHDFGTIYKYNPGSGIRTDLFHFDGSTTGSGPYGGLTLADNGMLYGETIIGGVEDNGVFFQYNPDPTDTVPFTKLRDFTWGASGNGANPKGSVIQATNGKLYGLTTAGGNHGQGCLFEYDIANDLFNKVYDFDYYTNGSAPSSSIMQASNGKLYGTTSDGGAYIIGTLFEYDPATASYAKDLDFDIGGDGANPAGSLIEASNGKLYGMTSYGGAGKGNIFEYNRTTNTFASDFQFSSLNGYYPKGDLVQASNGLLYGATRQGGIHDNGVIFQFDPVTNTFTKLYDLLNTGTAEPGGGVWGNLIQAANGKLYGLSAQGGATGQGALFEFDITTNTFAWKYDFSDATGVFPNGSLVQASNGKLYGTTSYLSGGNRGAIFEYDPATNVFAKKTDFTTDAVQQLVEAANGKLYGLTYDRNGYTSGTLFEYDYTTDTYATKANFSASIGSAPKAPLMKASNGKLYGITSAGGANGWGTVYEYDYTTNTLAKTTDFTPIFSVAPTQPATNSLIEVSRITAIISQPASTAVCLNAPFSFSVRANTANLSYQWFFNGNAISGATASTYNAGSASVSNAGGYYCQLTDGTTTITSTTATLTVNSLPIALAITGPTDICTGHPVTLTATGAANYLWSNGATTSSITLTPTVTTAYTVIGTTPNGCTAVDTQMVYLHTNVGVPGVITGPTNVCSYINAAGTATYTIVNVAGSPAYNWTVPTGGTIVSGQGTTSITVSYSGAFAAGNVAVQSVGVCNTTAFRTLAINATLPVMPSVITGTANVCSYVGTSTNLTYSIAPVTTATSYNWTVPAGATIVSGQGTTSILVNFSAGFTPGNVTVQSVAGCGSSTARVLALTTPLPPAPAAITGLANVCSYIGTSSTVTYSTAAIATATSYNWTVPAGAAIVSGQGTTSINVSFNNTFVSGNVGVQSVAGCGSSAFKTLAVTKVIPAAPVAITGPANVCSYVGTSGVATYAITAIAGATSYNWTVPTGATIASGQGTASIDVNFDNTFLPGNISVQSVAACGSSLFKTLAVTKVIPAAPTAITGIAAVCAYVNTTANVTYSITAVSGATSYNWTVPAGASIVSGQGSTSIDVSYSSSFVSGNVSVQSAINCGSSAFKTLAITQTLPTAPLAITGPAGVCAYVGSSTNAVYSIAAVAGATYYIWSAPAGATIVSGQGTTSISVSYSTSFVSGNLSVTSVAGCGSSAAKTLAISKTLPAAPASITGATNACSYMGSTSVTAVYTAAAVSGATSYNWAVPAGATIVSGNGTSTINVSYSASFVSGNISVQAITNCGSSAAKTLAITKTAPASPAAISGIASVCSYVGSSSTVTYSVTAVSGATSYTWAVPGGAGIVSGQGTTSIAVSYSTSFVSGNVSVQAAAGCGSSLAKTLAITKTLPTAPVAINGPTGVCALMGSAATATYTISPVAGAVSYNWTVPTGATLSSGNGTTSITVSYSTSFVTGNISVQAVANCGSSAAKTLAITKTLPAAPAAISGITNVCSYAGTATNVVYTITAVSGANSYNWTVPSDASIVSGQGTTSLTVNYAGSFVSGNIAVQSVAGCGSSIAKTLAITKTIMAPGTITGPANVCDYIGASSNATYYIAAVTGADSYLWTVPTGATIVSGQGTVSIDVSFSAGFVPGNITVQSVAACGSSVAKLLALTKAPAAVATISGPTAICGITTTVYSVAVVPGVTSYNWTLPKGITPDGSVTGTISTSPTSGITTITGGAASVSVNIDTNIVTTALALLRVSASNACATSALKTVQLTACRSLMIDETISANTATEYSIYPNPFTDHIVIASSSKDATEITILIYNTLGEIVWSGKQTISAGSSTSETDLSNFKPGMYTIELVNQTGQKISRQRIIKQ